MAFFGGWEVGSTTGVVGWAPTIPHSKKFQNDNTFKDAVWVKYLIVDPTNDEVFYVYKFCPTRLKAEAGPLYEKTDGLAMPIMKANRGMMRFRMPQVTYEFTGKERDAELASTNLVSPVPRFRTKLSMIFDEVTAPIFCHKRV